MHAAGPSIPRNYLELCEEKNGTEFDGVTLPSAKELADMARKGDPTALETFCQEGRYLGKAVAAIGRINQIKTLHAPSSENHFFRIKQVGTLFETYKENVYYYANSGLKILHTALGYEAALLGAAAVALRNLQ